MDSIPGRRACQSQCSGFRIPHYAVIASRKTRRRSWPPPCPVNNGRYALQGSERTSASPVSLRWTLWWKAANPWAEASTSQKFGPT